MKKIRTATPYPKNPHVGKQYQTIGTWISRTESTLMYHVDFYKQVISIIKEGTLSNRIFSTIAVVGLMDFINTQRPTSVNPPIRTVYAHQDKFVNLQTFRSGYTIQIKFTFTLYGYDLFNLYRLHPVPVMLHKETITIIPRTEFLAIDELTDNHVYPKDLNDCASDYNITYYEPTNTIIPRLHAKQA